jgi:hypothetical protein
MASQLDLRGFGQVAWLSLGNNPHSAAACGAWSCCLGPKSLTVCRSIGDRHAGERVLAEPEVSQVHIGSRGARMLLASDGLWDVATGKSAAHKVRNVAYSKAAARLRSFAKDQRDRDDITVIVIDALSCSNDRIPAALTALSSENSIQQDLGASDPEHAYQVGHSQFTVACIGSWWHQATHGCHRNTQIPCCVAAVAPIS